MMLWIFLFSCFFYLFIHSFIHLFAKIQWLNMWPNLQDKVLKPLLGLYLKSTSSSISSNSTCKNHLISIQGKKTRCLNTSSAMHENYKWMKIVLYFNHSWWKSLLIFWNVNSKYSMLSHKLNSHLDQPIWVISQGTNDIKQI